MSDPEAQSEHFIARGELALAFQGEADSALG
jgi:hypothetical protein